MTNNIIHILPEHVANQIAAGEVIQRPASAVKEMLENAIDSGADQISLLISNAGKELIQVIDNGCGMNTFDARMSFERHATSKIRKAEDLSVIRTMGFRGEALASIASVAQVELKTKLHEEESGTHLIIEGGKVVKHEACGTISGTSLSVKNLFYNLPARRNFLKSNPVETRHILEEFNRVSLAYPEISFRLFINGIESSYVKPSNLRQRICALLGQYYDERLVPIEEDTRIIGINGFIIKPEFAKKTRGEQYFFVNKRFIKDAYLNHAVVAGYSDLLGSGTYPSYFINLQIDPEQIDINIHPTKHEIKFADEKSIYAILRAAVKRSLGRFSISPSLDFELDPSTQIPLSKYKEIPVQPVVNVNKSYNPFLTSKSEVTKNDRPEDWNSFYKNLHQSIEMQQSETVQTQMGIESETYIKIYGQWANTFIIAQYGKKLIIGDQKMMHEKLLYEQFLYHLQNQAAHCQQCLFPSTVNLQPMEMEAFKELNPLLTKSGFDVQIFGKDTVAIHGIPTIATHENPGELLKEIIDEFMQTNQDKNEMCEKISRTLSTRFAIHRGKILTENEMEALIKDLMKIASPSMHPSGKVCFKSIHPEELMKWMQSN